ncbi:SSU ribosomal protein S20P [Natranaerovirga hydrolytica]|uniref:Small ribosomal subunit protein bS20 n=1 Tax=Natranaerovirga hydrolytica TaxID=680378 RepID=A0A4R1MXE5_9FIRM|nr:30S ribosomal protein S20 [Natranaerovirga hydrolytica]TCK97876.1 SSU ribosomal protein S20P [Natranaerovirga hydrolytica]
MANIKSAKKRILVTRTKTIRNKAIKTRVKSTVKHVFAAIEAKDKALAQDKLKVAISEINKAATKGIFHKNTAARKISRLTKRVNSIA